MSVGVKGHKTIFKKIPHPSATIHKNAIVFLFSSSMSKMYHRMLCIKEKLKSVFRSRMTN